MPKASPRKRERVAFLLDADRLGLLAGTFCAVVVMGICFFIQDVGGFEVAFRAVVTFGLTYVAIHVLVRVVLQPMLGARIARSRKRLVAEAPSPGDAAAESAPPAPGPEEGI
jgi:hypothetical protein